MSSSPRNNNNNNNDNCSECDDYLDKHIAYHCDCCCKRYCSDCIACIEGDVGNPKEQKRICVNCFDTTSVRNCNDCHKLCRSEFSTCWTCHKTDICDYCITMYRYDDGEELCTECNIKKNKRYEERNRDWREEYERREAEHRRNWGGYKKNT